MKACAEYVGNSLKICTVIGFPNGYSTTAVKVFETEDAIRNGADEIDMVINIGWAKDSAGTTSSMRLRRSRLPVRAASSRLLWKPVC